MRKGWKVRGGEQSISLECVQGHGGQHTPHSSNHGSGIQLDCTRTMRMDELQQTVTLQGPSKDYHYWIPDVKPPEGSIMESTLGKQFILTVQSMRHLVEIVNSSLAIWLYEDEKASLHRIYQVEDGSRIETMLMTLRTESPVVWELLLSVAAQAHQYSVCHAKDLNGVVTKEMLQCSDINPFLYEQAILALSARLPTTHGPWATRRPSHSG